MLRANRSTFKPTAGSCLDRNNSVFSNPESLGFGEETDVSFNSSDNFTDFENASTQLITVPSDASIIRVYASAGGVFASCRTYTDPCAAGGSPIVLCPSNSDCCPNCATGLCCIKETGQCGNGVCEDDCDGCWQKFSPEASAEAVEEACKFCGNAACCDCQNGCSCIEGPLCFGKGIGSNCDPVPDCNSCNTQPPGTSWKCGEKECEDSPTCACVEIEGTSGYPTQAQCEAANPGCTAKEPGDRIYLCCDTGCIEATYPDSKDPIPTCPGGIGSPFYCTEDQCAECCDSERGIAFSRENSAFNDVVVPAFSTNKKNAGDDLSSTELSILNLGKPTLTTATSIDNNTANAYNARLLHANLLNSTNVFRNIDNSSLVLLQEQAGETDTCNVCDSDGGFLPGENVNCGSALPSMFIAEYDLGELCSSLTKVELEVVKILSVVDRNSDVKEEYLKIEVFATPLNSDGNEIGSRELLLVDVVESGYVVPNDEEGTIDCDTCGLTFDCTGTEVVNGGYPTIKNSIDSSDIAKYSIPVNQATFPILNTKLQNKRISTHQLGDSTVSITTCVLAVGSNSIPIYTSGADDDMIALVTGGPADFSPKGTNTNLTTRLVTDSDRALSETAGNTFIDGSPSSSENPLQNHYGLPGMGECAIAGEYSTPGEALFAVVFSDTPRTL